MINILNKFKEKKLVFYLALASVVNLLIFEFYFGFHPNNDTDSFIWLIDFFRDPQGLFYYPNRYLNPFYAVVSAKLLFFLPSDISLITINVIFYFGLVFLTYGLIRRVFKNNFIGFVSALIMMTSYAMLRYGLTQVQDMGGYFWFLLTIYVGWRWWEDKKISWLLLGGVAVSFGVLTKESGCMGALFVGVLFLLDKALWRKRFFNFVVFSFFPFITIIINSFRSKDVDYNSLLWFLDAWRIFGPENYTPLKWLGVHVTTYNILWVFIFLGAYYIFKNWRVLDKNIKVYLLAVLPSSFSYYLWSLFISRTVFISAWFFIPIAVYGIYIFSTRSKNSKFLAVVFIFLCLLTPYILQATLRYANLFKVLDVCNKNPVCSWNYFWNNRSNFSTTGDRNYFDYK